MKQLLFLIWLQIVSQPILILKMSGDFFYVKEKDIWIEKFLFSFRFMKISREGSNCELFIRVRRQISPLILSEFKRIN